MNWKGVRHKRLYFMLRRASERARKAWAVKAGGGFMTKREFHLLRDLVSLRKFRKSFVAVEEHNADDTGEIAREITHGVWPKGTDFCICYHKNLIYTIWCISKTDGKVSRFFEIFIFPEKAYKSTYIRYFKKYITHTHIHM